MVVPTPPPSVVEEAEKMRLEFPVSTPATMESEREKRERLRLVRKEALPLPG